MCSSSKDDDAISSQIRSLYSRGNTLIKNFSNCSDDVKCQLFKTYCTSFYGSNLWCNYNTEIRRRIKVAYNRIFRVLFKLEHRISMSHNLLQYGVNHFDIILRKSMYGLMNRVNLSDNVLVQTMYNSSHYFESALFQHWANNLFVVTVNT